MDLAGYFPIWNRLSPSQKERLTGNLRQRKVPKGTVIHQGGMECTGLLMVASGQLRAYILSEDGRQITLYRLFDRDMCLLSASCILRSMQFEITVEAEKDTHLGVISPEIYQSLLEESAPLANFTNELMASRFSEVMWLMEQVLWKRFDQRLADFLLKEAQIEGTPVLKITHEAIGSHMGNPREVVTRMLRYFQNEGMVKLSRGTVELTDRERLSAVAAGA